MKKIKMTIKGQEKEIPALKMAGKLWLQLNGETLQYAPDLLKNQVQKGGDIDPRSIHSPMPGKVIKLLKREGDIIDESQTLVVIEAMKMEYNLKAQKKMKIKKIHCAEGKTVNLGQKLVELEEIND